MATAKNDITGDSISTKYNSTNFVNNFDLIDWGNKKEKKYDINESNDLQDENIEGNDD